MCIFFYLHFPVPESCTWIARFLIWSGHLCLIFTYAKKKKISMLATVMHIEMVRLCNA